MYFNIILPFIKDFEEKKDINYHDAILSKLWNRKLLVDEAGRYDSQKMKLDEGLID